MNSLKQRFLRLISSNRAGLLVFSILLLSTAVAVAFAEKAAPKPPRYTPPTTSSSSSTTNGQVTLSSSLSQTKLVQGEHGLIYLELTVDTPQAAIKESKRMATDMVVVLDRSGSMAEAKKLNYAKIAIRNLLTNLSTEDRFALVGFDNYAQVYAPLTQVTNNERERLLGVVSGIRTGGSTNIGDGLQKAKAILEGSSEGRARKVLLLSDGQVNVGITDPQQLATIAESFNTKEAVVSTIGMGLGFNEVLLSSLADHGMGNYSYLESLNTLDTMLARELGDARNTFARASSISFEVPSSVKLTDAAGYPFTISGTNSQTIVIRSGALFSGRAKSLIATLKVPTHSLAEINISNLKLNYENLEGSHTIAQEGSPMVVAVVPMDKRSEALASVNQEVYEKSWISNNAGLLKKKVSHFLRQGDKAEAERAIADYRSSVVGAEKKSRAPLLTGKLKEDLDEMEGQVNDAFSGSAKEQSVKQNRAAKGYLYESLSSQRSNY